MALLLTPNGNRSTIWGVVVHAANLADGATASKVIEPLFGYLDRQGNFTASSQVTIARFLSFAVGKKNKAIPHNQIIFHHFFYKKGDLKVRIGVLLFFRKGVTCLRKKKNYYWKNGSFYVKNNYPVAIRCHSD